MSEHIENILFEYMDDELSEAEKQKVVKHLSICSDCNKRLHELKALREEMLATYFSIDIPNSIEEKVILKIQQATEKNKTLVLNLLAFSMLFAFVIMLYATTGPFLTVGLPIFHSIYSITRGLIYAVPSIISAIPYVVQVIIALILSFIIFAILTLRYLVHTLGKTVRAEDI